MGIGIGMAKRRAFSLSLCLRLANHRARLAARFCRRSPPSAQARDKTKATRHATLKKNWCWRCRAVPCTCSCPIGAAVIYRPEGRGDPAAAAAKEKKTLSVQFPAPVPVQVQVECRRGATITVTVTVTMPPAWFVVRGSWFVVRVAFLHAIHP